MKKEQLEALQAKINKETTPELKKAMQKKLDIMLNDKVVRK